MRVSRAITALIAGLLVSITARAAETDPIFAGVWSHKEPGGTGALFFDLTWDNLVSRWKELGSNQYLADVEVYRHNGQLRYAGVWRIGPGNGALFVLDWADFGKKWSELKETQDLIDLEIFEAGGGLKYLGIWRHKQGGNKGSGAFLAGLTWEQLVARWKELGASQYLADVETFVSNGKRLFAGVWRIGSGNGALYLLRDWQQFAEMKKSLNASQDMIDFEMFQTEDGLWSFLGVWRNAGGPRRNSDEAGGALHASNSSSNFWPLSADQFVDQWDKLKPTQTLVNIAIVVPSTILLGDTKCKYGDVDCNRCAPDVPNQFRLAFETGHRPWVKFDGGSWNFSGSTKYPPDNVKPEDAFIPANATKHVQGLVRTNSSRYPYAGSHSHTDKGSIFFIGVDKNGKNSLFSLHRSNVDHPSGVHVLGDGLYVAEDDRIRWFGISAAIDEQNKDHHTYVIKGLQGAGGGLGLAKLQDGTYLLVVTVPGDGFRTAKPKENLEPRYTRFYRIFGNDAGHPEKIQFIGEWTHGNISDYPKTPLAYSENLSLVTECGTGHLYTIHTTGQWGINGDGYWRLSRVETGSDSPRLQHISIVKQAQRAADCHHRSSATVHVNAKGELEFLCSERKVTKVNPSGTFNFKEGKW